MQFVLGEVALRWRQLPPDLVARQATHLAQISSLPNVTVGIIPVDAELPACSRWRCCSCCWSRS
jgi:hypothetical protein